MKSTRRIPAYLFLLLLAWVTVPREYIHELFHPEESCEIHCTNNGSDQFTQAHVHCQVLNYAASTWEPAVPGFTFCLTVISETFFDAFTFEGVNCFHSIYFLRGPPLTAQA